eukprot:TRINITY_DN16604_c0_g1_i1.p1 TRINITY_DN16604_c0_g1~~TRINITY_DN16604_c0_g1_i1.p1  ORF type:complete len:1298 (-),score=348.24 TRINITY_DN16604_c0_g1_i1:93-3986(-)
MAGTTSEAPRLDTLPVESAWVAWRGPVSQPTANNGCWRSYPHLQKVTELKRLMVPRVQEFCALLGEYSQAEETLGCKVCNNNGGLMACYADDLIAQGGKLHLKKLWSRVLQSGPELWQEVRVDGGAMRYNYLDGTLELCRGQPPAASSSEAVKLPGGPEEELLRMRRPGEDVHSQVGSVHSSPSKRKMLGSLRRAKQTASALLAPVAATATSSASSSSSTVAPASDASSSSTGRLSAAVSPAPPGGLPPQLGGGGGLGDYVAAEARLPPPLPGSAMSVASAYSVTDTAATSPTIAPSDPPEDVPLMQAFGLTAVAEEDSECEERVTLDGARGIEIGPVKDGCGAVVIHSEGAAQDAGVEPGAQILSINDEPVEDLPTEDIKGMLDREPNLPITLDVRPPLNLPSVKRRKKRTADPVTVCTANCRGSYRVVSESVERLGWQEVPGDVRTTAVVWLEGQDSAEGLAPVQTVTRIEAFLPFCQKARLAQSLNTWVEALPDEFAFTPRTWVLPYDIEELKEAMRKVKETYICKPTAGCQGRGIILARKWKELDNAASKAKAVHENPNKRSPLEYVVQRYIEKPCLLDGLKFDMRLYIVVTGVVPLCAYLFKEGLARFCTVPYQPPKEGNLRDARMHLTNFAVNKKSAQFQASESLAQHDEGSKRSVSAVLRQIEAAYGVDAAELWQKIAALAANTLVALRPGLLEWYVHEKARPLHPLGPKSFQIVGLDVIIDSNLEPRLLELNANSSLSVLQPTPAGGDPNAAEAAVAAAASDVIGDPAAPPAPSSSSVAAPPPPPMAEGPSAAPGDPPMLDADSASASPSADAAHSAASQAAGKLPLDEAAIAPPVRAASEGAEVAAVRSAAAAAAAEPQPAPAASPPPLRSSLLGARHTITMKKDDLRNSIAAHGTLASSSSSKSMVRSSTVDNIVSRFSSLSNGKTRPGSAKEAAGKSEDRKTAGRRVSSETAKNGGGVAVAAAALAARTGSHQTMPALTRKSQASPGRARGLPGGGARQASRPRAGRRGTVASARGEESASGSAPAPTIPGTSELDLEIKRELVSHALMLSKPSPQNKCQRLRKVWFNASPYDECVPLDDEGRWAIPQKQIRCAATRPDAPERCPALEHLDLEALAAEPVLEYAKAHLQTYRVWRRNCGTGRDTLGQAQMLRLMEKLDMVGPGSLFQDRIAAQLWLSRIWRDVAMGSYGLNLPQFVAMAGRLGRMINGEDKAQVDMEFHDGGCKRNLEAQREGLLEFISRGGDAEEVKGSLPPIGSATTPTSKGGSSTPASKGGGSLGGGRKKAAK